MKKMKKYEEKFRLEIIKMHQKNEKEVQKSALN